MASILDALFPTLWQGVAQPELPSPNPLRAPAVPPAMSFNPLESIFRLPNLNPLTLGATDLPVVEETKKRKGEEKAREAYQQGVNPETRAGQNAAAKNVSVEEGENEDEDAGDVPPLPARSPFSGGASGRRAAAGQSGGEASVSVLPQTADPMKAALLQLGLNLMVPQWGSGIAALGEALGGAVGAGGRAQQINEREAEEAETKAQKAGDKAAQGRLREAQIRKLQAETEEIQEGSGESSRSKRLRSKTPSLLDEAAASAGLGPKGKLYLQQRIKDLNKFDPLVDEGEPDPVARLQGFIEEAKKLDAPSAPAKAPNVGGTETIQALPLVSSPEEAKKLQPGTRFYFQDPTTKQLTIGTVPKNG